MLPLGVSPRLLNLVDLGAEYPARVGEEHEPVVGCRDNKVLHNIVCSEARTSHALAAAMLNAVVTGSGALDVAAGGEGNHHLFHRNEVLNRDIAVEAHHDFAAAIVAILGHDLVKLLANNLSLQGLVLDDLLVALDLIFEFGRLVDDLLSFERRQLA